MKKVISILASVLVLALVFSGCSQVGTNVVSVNEVSAKSLQNSGATQNVTSSEQMMAVIGSIATDNTTIGTVTALGEDLSAGAANAQSRSVSYEALKASLLDAYGQIEEFVTSVNQNDAGTLAIDIKKKGKVTGLKDGLSFELSKAKANVNYSYSEEEEDGSVDADAAVDASAGIDFVKLAQAYGINGTPVIKDASANAAANAAFRFTLAEGFKGKAGVAFSSGVSVVNADGLGGKFIVSGYVSVKSNIETEALYEAIDVIGSVIDNEGEITDEEAAILAAVGLECNLKAAFYDDAGNETYSLINAESTADLVSQIGETLSELTIF